MGTLVISPPTVDLEALAPGDDCFDCGDAMRVGRVEGGKRERDFNP